MELRQTDQRQMRRRSPTRSTPSPIAPKKGLGDAIDVVTEMCAEWRELGRKLGLRNVDIEKTDQKHRDPTECCREVLELWRRSNGTQATLEKLGEALRKARRVDVAEMIEGIEGGGDGSDLRIAGKPGDVEVVKTSESWTKIKWTPPANSVDGMPIGYMVDRCRVGTDECIWVKAHKRDYLNKTEFTVGGLKKKGQYYFRVTSVYRGRILSDPSYSPLGIAKIQDQPDKPRNLKVIDLENNAVTLEWLEPEDDGGYPITSYIVEKCQRRKWKKCLETPEMQCTIRGMKSAKDWRLRLSAKNSKGVKSDSVPAFRSIHRRAKRNDLKRTRNMIFLTSGK